MQYITCTGPTIVYTYQVQGAHLHVRPANRVAQARQKLHTNSVQ